MDIVKKLHQIKRINKDINSLIREKEQVYFKGIGGSNDTEKVQSSNIGDIPCDLAIKIMEYENQILTEIDKLVNLKKSISQNINALENYAERTVLRDIYITCMTHEETAEENDISVSWVKVLEKRGIMNLKNQSS